MGTEPNSLTHVQALLERYRLALQGIASCATNCGSCQMLRAVALEALGP